MKLSVIVPMYHAYFFDDIMASYVWQDIKTDYEVLFMMTGKDSGACQCTIDHLKKTHNLPWRVYNVPLMSNCACRNLGTKESTGEALLFIDGDQIIAPHLFKSHAKLHFALPYGLSDMVPKVGIGICNINVVRYQDTMDLWMPHNPEQRMMFSGKQETMPMQKVYSSDCLSFIKNLTLSQAIGLAWWHNMNDFADYVNTVGRNISVNKRKFVELGMWDEELAYSETTNSRGWEDLMMGLTMYKAGLLFEMVPSWTAHLEHPRMNKDGGLDNIVKLVRKHKWFLDERPDWWALRYDRNEIRRML